MATVSNTLPTVVAIIGIIGTVVAAFVAIRKSGPEKNALYISSAQGASVILNDLVSTLRQELDHTQTRIAALEAENRQLEADKAALAAENEGLRRRKGTRRSDSDGRT